MVPPTAPPENEVLQPGTLPRPPPPTPPLEPTSHFGTMVLMTPPELLDPPPRTPESQQRNYDHVTALTFVDAWKR